MDWVCPWQGELDAGVRVPNIVGPHRLATHSKGHQHTEDKPTKSGQRRPEQREVTNCKLDGGEDWEQD